MSDIIDIQERVQPARLKTKDGKEYVLDFNRDSVRFAETRSFRIDELTVFPTIRIPEMFYYSFRKNHKSISRTQTDALLESMGGLSKALLERLIQLYNQAALSNLIAVDEDSAKNAEVTVEL